MRAIYIVSSPQHSTFNDGSPIGGWGLSPLVWDCLVVSLGRIRGGRHEKTQSGNGALTEFLGLGTVFLSHFLCKVLRSNRNEGMNGFPLSLSLLRQSTPAR